MALALAGCPSRQAPAKDPTGVEPSPAAAAELSFRATGPLASHYGPGAPARVFGEEGKVLAAITRISRQLGKGDVSHDGATQAMARDICLGLAPKGPPPSRLVNFAMQSYGLVEPPPHFVVADVPLGAEDIILEEIEPRLRAILSQGNYRRAGVALQVPRPAGARRRLLVALMESRVTLRPIARRLARGQEAQVQATAGPGISGMKLVVAAPDGRITTTRLQGGSGRFACQAPGAYQVELTGEGQYGVEVLANFPVYCDMAPPETVAYSTGSGALKSVEALERAILRATNEIRLGAGLPALRPNQQLADLARAHSEDMKKNGFVGHVSPVTGTPSDRLRKGRVVFVRARENAARGYGVEEIMSGLMNSPAHRGNLLSKDVTEVGVGVAVDRRTPPPVLLVTQDFIQPGTSLPAASGSRPVVDEINRLRRVAGVGTLTEDPTLARIAAQVTRIARDGAPRAEDRAREALDRALDGLADSFKRIDSLQARMSVLEALSRASELVNARYTHLGVGLARQDDQMVLIILLGVSR